MLGFKISDEKKVEAFELWCYRRLLRISYTDRKSYKWLLEMIDCRNRLLGILNRRKMYFAGHIVRFTDMSCDFCMTSLRKKRQR